jgi:nitric oxide reductase subunit B
MSPNATANRFIVLGFTCLLSSILFGLIGSVQYLFPHFLSDTLSFQHTRPLHVFLAVSWIFTCVTGIIYRYIPTLSERGLYSVRLANAHFYLLFLALIISVVGFFMGRFSGREYLEFPPWVTIIIITYWVLFSINFILTVKPRLAKAPVYVWSWCTGLLFFLITIVEAHLWLLPFFNNNIIRDVTVQWKANGSMVGAWNMLIYGTAMFAMEKITGKKDIGYQKTSFLFYFLGLTNLMFNWGHHTYIVPAHPLVKQVSYIISMTELILLANIIMKWKKGLVKEGNDTHPLTVRFFRSADRWILLNLVLAIVISVPMINQYTHGTQITVAHAMGATIGINTMLLLGSVAFIFEKALRKRTARTVYAGLRIMNVSLLVFWLSLVFAGIVRSVSMQQHEYFSIISVRLLPFLRIFSVSAVFLVFGISLIVVNFLRVITLHKKRAEIITEHDHSHSYSSPVS